MELLYQNPGLQMPIVEVFKTNVLEDEQASLLISVLLDHFPQHKINFDLQDCDKILRVEGRQIIPKQIIQVMNKYGHECQALE